MGRSAIVTALLTLGGGIGAGAPAVVEAQAKPAADSVTVVPSTRYGAGGIKRILLGTGYRELWATPLRVPVLDLATFGGGLVPLRAGGGRQTRTLHFTGGDGRRYLFRSVEKWVEGALPDDLQDTPVSDLFQDHISAFHPTGALAVPRLLEAAGVLHVVPSLAVMPDDPRLGEHRSAFAGMLGQIEERPDEGEEGGPGFAGALEVIDMEELLERVGDDPADRPDARGYLAARLLDFVIGDTDRGRDQWRWAQYDVAPGGYSWRPIPRDRDWAFIRSTGVLAHVARTIFPKLVAFEPEYPPLSGLVFSSIQHDRLLLAELDRFAWDSAAAAVRDRLTDDVIAAAVGALPPEHHRVVAADMMRGLRGRTERLPRIARRFYHRLAGTVDVQGTAQADRAEVELLPDGSVVVRLLRRSVPLAAAPVHGPLPLPSQPYFERRFLPGETREVRIDLGDGDDAAIVRGDASPIVVRIIGGAGDDSLADASAARGRVAFYDAAGRNTIESGALTRIDTRPFTAPADPEDWVERKVVGDRYRDWGSSRSVRPVLDIRESDGVVLGVAWSSTGYGFRRVPRAQRVRVSALYSLETQRAGLEFIADRTWENSPWSAWVRADATGFAAIRFYGFGNDAPAPADHDVAVVHHDRMRIEPGLGVTLGRSARIDFGLRGDYTRPRYPAGSPIARFDGPGIRAFGAAGTWVEGELRRMRGDSSSAHAVRLTVGSSAMTTVTGSSAVFGDAFADGRAHLTFGPTLALRAGGSTVWGDFPIQDAAFVGGRQTLRGHRFQRFAGDAALYSGAEVRAPLTRATLLVRGDVGVLGFADAARVFVRGASPGGWHTAAGGGVSFSSLGTTASVTFAAGEERRVYFSLGMPF